MENKAEKKERRKDSSNVVNERVRLIKKNLKGMALPVFFF